MTGHTTEDLAQRLGKLEGQTRRLKLYVAVLAAILGAILVMGQTSPDKSAQALIEAREFVLVDEAGKQRARLGLTDGQPFLTFCRETGDVAVNMGLSGRVPILVLSEVPPSKASIELTLDGAAYLKFLDFEGHRWLGVTHADGDCVLNLADVAGGASATLIVGSEGSSLGLQKDRGITTVLGNGKNWSYLLFKEGHKARTEIGLSNGQPQIRLTGKDGKSLFTAP